jgi:hypothetical protein
VSILGVFRILLSLLCEAMSRACRFTAEVGINSRRHPEPCAHIEQFVVQRSAEPNRSLPSALRFGARDACQKGSPSRLTSALLSGMRITSRTKMRPLAWFVETVAATGLQFSVAISPDQYLQLDDVVVTSRQLPGQGPVQVSGVVTNVEAVHEGARFPSDVFLIQQGALPAAPFQNVRVFAPPRPGDTAGTPDVTARDKAVSRFYWTLAEFCEQELLPFVFADAEDERAQYTMLIPSPR